MMRSRSFLKLVFLFATLSVNAYGQTPPWTGIIAPSRATNWSEAGVSGGIPSGSWTQCGSTIAAYGTASSPGSPATIQTAISNCTANHYVQLGAGNFYLSGSFYIKGQSNIEIRGMGANSTFVYFYGNTGIGGDNCGGIYALVCLESADLNWVGNNGSGAGPSNGPVNWTSGYSQGTTVITLASVPNLKIGNPILLDQLDTPSDVGSILISGLTTGGNQFTAPGNAGPYATQGNSGNGMRAGRSQLHVYTVAGCNGSTTIGAPCSGTNVAVTIDPPIEEVNWSSSLAPQAWWATSPSTYVGVQNLSIDATNSGCSAGNGYGIGFFNVVNGWDRGTRDVNECRSHTGIEYSARITVRDTYMFLSRYSTQTSYGFECFGASDSLVENNIMQAIAGAIILNDACDGLVFGYNFQINGYYTAGGGGFVIPMANQHNANNDYVLYEGNIGSKMDGDIIHGTHNFDTFFRNRWSGTNVACWAGGPGTNDLAGYLNSTWGPCTNAVTAFEVYSNNRFFNVIGNVLGVAGVTPNYKNVSTTAEVDGYVFNIGVGDNNTGVTVAPDSTVTQTIMLWGNCDNVNGFSAANCVFSSSNVPVTANLATSQQPYANTVPASHTLPASFYYSSKPAWWPASKPWPSIGPDVTGGNISGTGGLAYTNPAQDCYNSLSGSTANGTGGPFPFDANTCYGAGGVSSPPAPPTNLTVAVN